MKKIIVKKNGRYYLHVRTENIQPMIESVNPLGDNKEFVEKYSKKTNTPILTIT